MIDAAGTEDLLSGLTPAQRAAVVSDAAPLCVVAAAGAGKTRVLTRRIAYRCRTGRADAGHTLALTFTRKAAGELQDRLGGLGLRGGVVAGTFHSVAIAQLQRWWADRGQRPPALLERKSRVLGPLVAARPALAAVALSEVAGLIEWAKARTVEPDGFQAAVAARGRPLPSGVDAAEVGALYARYEHEKRKRGLVDFDDLLSRLAAAIESDPELAGAQRWRWRHIYVDEFQDLNPLQHRLLVAWLGASRDLCVVGDPHQAIYGWNGSDPGLLAAFATRWPGAEVLHLDANHRCPEPIVRAAAAVLGAEGARLHGVDREGPAPVVAGFHDEREEAAAIATAFAAAHRDGRRWGRMAVLTRTNAQLGPVEDALTAARVPSWSAATAGLLDEPVVREVMAGWRAGGWAARPLRAGLADLAEMAAGGEVPADDASRPALTALADTGRFLIAARPEASVGDWLAWLPATVRDRSDRIGPPDAVTLSTFHRAKGLEWDLVWVAGVGEGLVPMGRSLSEEAEGEERRLLYVALTRAVQEVRVSWAARRSFGARPVPRRPSRWLEAVVVAADEWRAAAPAPAAPDGSWSRRLAEQRAALRESATRAGHPLGRRTPQHWPAPDPRVRTALLSWRTDTARHTGVPPQVLLHDATLEAIACLQPHTLDELLAIPGFGAVKAARYGPVLLDLVGERAAIA